MKPSMTSDTLIEIKKPCERNRYVHEFSRLVADAIGETLEDDCLTQAIERVLLLLRFLQLLKTHQYGGSV
jgi:hypothetical protein